MLGAQLDLGLALDAVRFEDDDLVFALFQQRRGYVQGLLRPDLPIPTDVKSVDGDKPLGETVKLHKGVLRRVDVDEASVKRRFFLCFTVAEFQPVKIIHR